VALIVLGLMVGAGTLLAHLAHALPIGELFGRSSIWLAAGSLGVGAALFAVSRGWVGVGKG
jgi:hypothetical protein